MQRVVRLRGMRRFLILGWTPKYASRSFLIFSRIVIVEKVLLLTFGACAGFAPTVSPCWMFLLLTLLVLT